MTVACVGRAAARIAVATTVTTLDSVLVFLLWVALVGGELDPILKAVEKTSPQLHHELDG